MEEKKRQRKWIKTLQFLAAYLVAAWTFLQFLEWILNRYNISPNWVDLFLWVFIGVIPSMAIYFYHQDRINKKVLKLREKIIFPLNFILLAIVVYFAFGNTDLGATTKEIKYTDEEGLKQSKTITKEEFRIGVPIYGFKNLSTDDSIDWLSYGIGNLLYEDLLQNKSISPEFSNLKKTTDKIKEASLFYDFYVDGTFKKNEDSQFEITTFVRKASNGKILKKQLFTGQQILPLLDDISVFIASEFGFTESKTVKYLDFPINEFITNSLDAAREYVEGNYNKAFEIDSTFALAYLRESQRLLRYNRGQLEVQDLSDKAYTYRRKLPAQKQLEVNIQRNLAYENYADAEEQVKLNLEVDPNNDFYNDVLAAIYGETRQIEKYRNSVEALFRRESNSNNGINLAIASMVNGDEDELINELKTYEVIEPNLKMLKLQPILFKGDFKKAEKLLKDIKIQYPDFENRYKVYDSALAYLKSNKITPKDLEVFVGRYRSDYSEQIQHFWISNDRLIQFVKNQQMMAYNLAGPNTLVSGFINERTWRYDLKKGDNGKPVGFRVEQNYYNNSEVFWYWKEDDFILKAHEALENGNLEEAEKRYVEAIKENPYHQYLNNYLSHIRYTLSKSKDSIIDQHQSFAGSYGPREFWVENGKFYYKRKSDDNTLPKFELLAIDENRYMDLTRARTIMVFESGNSGKLASASYSYNPETKLMERGDETNYFLRD